MHFRAEMTVVFDGPMPIKGPDSSEEATGYLIVIGINAPDIAIATSYAHEVALRPKQADGNFRALQGVVTEARVRRVEKTDWQPALQQKAERIDHDGVYYSSGLIYFGKSE